MNISRGIIKGAQKIILYGVEGIGKSTFASQFPNPVFIDTEGSTRHMDVSRTDKPSSWAMLIEQVKYFKANPVACKTLIIDTVDWAERLCKEHICSKANKEGIESFGYGHGYTYLAEEFGKFLNLLTELIDQGINVVLTAHAAMRKFEQPDEMGAYDRWEMKLEKKVFPLVKEWADMVLFANYKTYVVNVDNQGAEKGKNKVQGGKRVMYTSHHPCWDAKNRHNLQPELDFDYMQIRHCIEHEEVIYELTKQPEQKPEQKAETVVTPPPVQTSPPPAPNDLPGVPKALADLMIANAVSVEEIQQAVSFRGFYPVGTPFENYEPAFIDGCLVGAWDQVLQVIIELRKDEPY